MNSESMVRTTLNMSVVLNVVGAYLLAFPSSYAGKLVNLPTNVPLLYSVLLSFLVLMFAVIYGWLARQESVFQQLLFVGGFAKLCFFMIVEVLWILGHSSGEFAVIVLADLLFGFIWCKYMYDNKNREH